MTGAEFAALDQVAKARHVAGLSDQQRTALVNAVADFYQTKAGANDPDPFRQRANREFAAWAAKRAPR